MESSDTFKFPVGCQVLRKCWNIKLTASKKEISFRIFILFSTFISYVAFHMSRRPLSVVKNVLNRDCSKLTPPFYLNVTSENNGTWCSWEPFTGSNANQLLGYLDSSYLFAYAMCMFISGILAERFNIRYYLSFGMILSGLFTYLFGLAHNLEIHSYAYFVIIQILAGGFQSTGWPCVVACIGNWFGKTRRGMIFGIWNSHLYLGNILGAYVAGVFVETNWGMSFMIPGIAIGILGIFIFLFLVPYPEEVGLSTPYSSPDMEANDTPSNSQSFASQQTSTSCDIQKESLNTIGRNESLPLMKDLSNNGAFHDAGAITFMDAVRIPGVVEFSLCLFFSKLVSYTFLFWLPKYIDSKTQKGSEESAYLSVPFDVGGILGGIFAGIISDQTGSSALTCLVFLGFAIPSMFLYDAFGSINTASNIGLQVISGSLVNGPYALITTAVSAELGTHSSLSGNTKALATVTAIIDGTGSIGAAVGPLLAGVVSETNWRNVFYMMMVSDFLALLALSRVGWKEIKQIGRKRGWFSSWKF